MDECLTGGRKPTRTAEASGWYSGTGTLWRIRRTGGRGSPRCAQPPRPLVVPANALPMFLAGVAGAVGLSAAPAWLLRRRGGK